MSKIAVIGDRDSILGFKTIGLDIFPVANLSDEREQENAARNIHRLAREGYVIIFITEDAASNLGETIDRYKKMPFPAIILIPGNKGSKGLGMKAVKESVEKAIGADILFGERG